MEEDYLTCIPLLATTKANDVMCEVNNFFLSNELDWNKLISICTDGAPAMIGSRSGFIELAKEKNPRILGTHCFIHREALATKTLPNCLNLVLKTCINVVNFIKSHGVQTRLFRKFCEDFESDYSDLLFFTAVRWLSRGNMLKRLKILLEEIILFLEIQGKNDLLALLKKDDFEPKLNYLVDFFEKLNELNLKMQGPNSNIMIH